MNPLCHHGQPRIDCAKCAMESGDGPGYSLVMQPVVSPSIPLTADQRQIVFMAAKRLLDAAMSGERINLDVGMGYLKDL